ncbi:hydrogenase-4 component E [uncultured Desulfovibrio sp.]|uniref:hydrogenase-4 component E n=1 Tax=uncultured Desulfovibrio sp. TaxID=167968 RepID=UPI00262DFAE2|nr:hydrogenase-4 component E [uncultured Desulfovibrio sp.]
MSTLFQILIFGLALNDLALMGVPYFRGLIRMVTLQGFLLSGLLLAQGHAALALAVLAIKGFILPILLDRTRRRIGADPRLTQRFGCVWATLLGMAGLVFSLWLEASLPLLPRGFFPPLLLPVGLTTLFCGLIMVVSRVTALSQVIGYLVAENGIFLLSMPLMTSSAIWFEMTLLLDIFVAVFVMGIVINHINNTFESIDVNRFHNLRD